MGGRLVESLAVDLGKRSSDSSAIAMQWSVQKQEEREEDKKVGSHGLIQARKSIKLFYNI